MFNENILGERLKICRKSIGATLEEVGLQLDVTKTTVSRWEKGNRFPDVPMLSALADYFNVSADYLLGRTDDPHLYLGEAQMGGHGIMTAKAKVEKDGEE